MKFKNITTGNIVRTTNKKAIELMQKSDNYVPVEEKGKKPAKKTADK